MRQSSPPAPAMCRERHCLQEILRCAMLFPAWLARSAACLQAGSLLYFMCEDAPRMELSPPVRLPPGERQRLRKCTADVFTRYCAVCAGGPAASQQQVRPLHLSAVRAEAAHVQP